MAAMKQNDTVARLLIDFGADVYIENKSGLRPSALVPDHHPLYHFLRQCESTHPNCYFHFFLVMLGLSPMTPLCD